MNPNKNEKALLKFLELDKDPLLTLKDEERMKQWIGSFNQIVYGVNPYEIDTKKSEDVGKDDAENDVHED